MDIYTILFLDAFKALFLFSLGVETAWFAAYQFGHYNMFFVTAVCCIGALSAALITVLVGYGISYSRKYIEDLDEELYQELSGLFNKYGVYVFLFQMIPFTKLFLLFAGVFAVKWRRLLAVMVAGRVLYYLFYLCFPRLI